MFLECVRKGEDLERTHTDTVNIKHLHRSGTKQPLYWMFSLKVSVWFSAFETLNPEVCMRVLIVVMNWPVIQSVTPSRALWK